MKKAAFLIASFAICSLAFSAPRVTDNKGPSFEKAMPTTAQYATDISATMFALHTADAIIVPVTPAAVNTEAPALYPVKAKNPTVAQALRLRVGNAPDYKKRKLPAGKTGFARWKDTHRRSPAPPNDY